MKNEIVVFATQVRAARTLLGWKQSELAKRTGLAQPTVARIEKGSMIPRMSTVMRLRAVFKEYGLEFVDNHPLGGYTLQVSERAMDEAAISVVTAADSEGTE